MLDPIVMLIIFIGVILLTLIFTIAIIIIISYKHLKKMEELEMYKIHTGSVIDMSIPGILDLIIQESFDDYKVKILEVKPVEYISEEKEIEIRGELANIVSSRISPAAIEKLSLFYNKNNIADIIADKIYIAVVAYVVDYNKRKPNTK